MAEFLTLDELESGGASSRLPTGPAIVYVANATWEVFTGKSGPMYKAALTLASARKDQRGLTARVQFVTFGDEAKLLARVLLGANNGRGFALKPGVDSTLRVLLFGRVLRVQIGEREYTKKDQTTGTAPSVEGVLDLPDDVREKAYSGEAYRAWWDAMCDVDERTVRPHDLLYEAAADVARACPAAIPAEVLAAAPPHMLQALAPIVGGTPPPATGADDPAETPF